MQPFRDQQKSGIVAVLCLTFLSASVFANSDSNADLHPQGAAEPPSGSETQPAHLRLSAVVEGETGAYAGIINRKTGAARLVRKGHVFSGYTVEAVSPENRSVHLKRGEENFLLFLQGTTTYMQSLSDPDASFPHRPPSVAGVVDEGDEWDESIEPPPVYRTREDFLRTHADRLGMIEPDMPLPSAWTEPVSREEALRRMAESVGMEISPDALKPRTREDFLREHGLDQAP